MSAIKPTDRQLCFRRSNFQIGLLAQLLVLGNILGKTKNDKGFIGIRLLMKIMFNKGFFSRKKKKAIFPSHKKLCNNRCAHYFTC